MPIDNNPLPFPRRLALYIITRGAQLVSDAIGGSWDSDQNVFELDSDPHGFLDDIPVEDGPLWYWANAMVQILRLLVTNMNQIYLENSDPTSVIVDEID